MSGDDPFGDPVDVILPGEEEQSLEQAAKEILALPAVKNETPPQLLVVFPLRKSVPFPGLIMPVHAQDGYEANIMEKEEPMTYREKALAAGRNYTVSDLPPLGTAVLLGVQHYLTMLGATVSSIVDI